VIHVVVHGISKVGEACVKFSLKTLLHSLKIIGPAVHKPQNG
jgi:hypothetical protein